MFYVVAFRFQWPEWALALSGDIITAFGVCDFILGLTVLSLHEKSYSILALIILICLAYVNVSALMTIVFGNFS